MLRFAYARGASPIKCAKHHLGARWLVKIDIHDFFESISERRVYFAFRSCGYQPLVSFELARITTRVSSGKSIKEEQWHINQSEIPPGDRCLQDGHNGHLPQGAPTSPLLSVWQALRSTTSLKKLAARYQSRLHATLTIWRFLQVAILTMRLRGIW